MRVVLASSFGMCFGVRDALAAAGAVEDPQEVTVYGELVHNDVVKSRLAGRGFRQVEERDRRLPETSTVLVTAHGISDGERRRLAGAGLAILDTTCPLVRHAHDAALRLEAEDRLVVVVGRAEHVEVRGLTGDLRCFAVVSCPDEVRDFGVTRLGVVAQTTTPPAELDAVVAAIRAHNPTADLRVIDTVCRPTRERQEALRELLGEVDRLVVVGGRRSRNTLELVRSAAEAGIPAIRVESASEIDRAWFEGAGSVGLTAGTSALDETVLEVRRALEAL